MILKVLAFVIGLIFAGVVLYYMVGDDLDKDPEFRSEEPHLGK